MERSPDALPPREVNPDAPGRLLTAQVAALTGYTPGTVRDALRLGAITGSVKDARGRWWHDPEAVRRWRAGESAGPDGRAWRHRRTFWRGPGRLLTADGINPAAVEVDAETGCRVWLGASSGDRQPVGWDGTRYVAVRRVEWQRRHGPIPPGYQVRRTCPEKRCVNPDHSALLIPRSERPPTPRPLTVHQLRLGPIMPAERPEGMPEREWAILTGLVAGDTATTTAGRVGLSRQRFYVHLRRAEGRLRTGER